jgi:DNA topoisomerase-2
MNIKTKNTTEFFNSEYINWASYDNLRKIASLVDGQKNAARKVLWYVLTKNLKSEIKVSQLNSKVAEETEYLHGDMSGVIVNLAQDYTGTNNINLLSPEGNFGTRLVPEASASRYIYTYGTKELFEMFNPNDNPILEHQDFEGHRIEPKFLLPKLPVLLINGSEGISSGFAQKILPRNPKEIQKYIQYYLKKPDAPVKPFQNKPWYKDFKGEIKQGEDKNQWEIYGVFERKGNKVKITELPIGYNLKSYIKVLNKLEEDKKIIGYRDYSEDEFNFEVQFNRKYLDSLSDEKLIELLKLKKKVSENYTVMSEKNTVEVFDSVNDILWEYIRVKKEYLQKRKDYMIQDLSNKIRLDVSKYIFIKSIVEDKLIINKRKTEDIIEDLKKIDKIIPRDNSYDYLLGMSIQSLTEERLNQLMNKIKTQKGELDKIKNQSIEEMWLEEL